MDNAYGSRWLGIGGMRSAQRAYSLAHVLEGIYLTGLLTVQKSGVCHSQAGGSAAGCLCIRKHSLGTLTPHKIHQNQIQVFHGCFKKPTGIGMQKQQCDAPKHSCSVCTDGTMCSSRLRNEKKRTNK